MYYPGQEFTISASKRPKKVENFQFQRHGHSEAASDVLQTSCRRAKLTTLISTTIDNNLLSMMHAFCQSPSKCV